MTEARHDRARPPRERWSIVLLEGPNLDRVGRREPELYGDMSHAALRERCRGWAAELDCDLIHRQTDDEGELVREIHAAADARDGLIVNPGGLTHTSVALRDAVLAAGLPVVEMHLTNPEAREDFRRRSLLADVVTARICGFGPTGYHLALVGMRHLLDARQP